MVKYLGDPFTGSNFQEKNIKNTILIIWVNKILNPTNLTLRKTNLQSKKFHRKIYGSLGSFQGQKVKFWNFQGHHRFW